MEKRKRNDLTASVDLGLYGWKSLIYVNGKENEVDRDKNTELSFF